MTLTVDGFRGIGGIINGELIEVGRLSFTFEMTCRHDCELLLMQVSFQDFGQKRLKGGCKSNQVLIRVQLRRMLPLFNAGSDLSPARTLPIPFSRMTLTVLAGPFKKWLGMH